MNENEKRKQLENLVEEFDEAFAEAYRKRRQVTGFLEDEYDIDTYENADHISDENRWLFGFNMDHIENLIKKGEKNEG